MPPKKETKKPGKWVVSKNCGWRDIIPLQDYVQDPSKLKGFLANILHESGYLENYDLVPNLNECVLSFPASEGTDSHEWFGAYLQKSDGTKYWRYVGPDGNWVEKPYVYYFKTVMGADGYPQIDTSSHSFNKLPPQLVGLSPCVFEGGKCTVPKKEKTPTKKQTVAQARAKPEGTAEQVVIPDQRVAAVVEALQLGPPPESETVIKNTASREEAEKWDKKTMIDWIKKYMNPSDVSECLRTGALSAEDRKQIDSIVADGRSAIVGGESVGEVVEAAAAAAAQMKPTVVQRMFQQISRKDLIDQINTIKDANQRKLAIVDLCQRANINITSKTLPNGNVRIIGTQGQTMEPDDALTGCAAANAARARAMLTQRLRSPLREFAREGRDEIWPVFDRVPPAVEQGMASLTLSEGPSRLTPTQAARTADIIDDLKGLLDEGEYDDFVAAVNNTGIFVDLRDDGMYVNGRLIEIDSEDMEDLIDQAALNYIKKFNVAFGARRGCKSVRKNAKHPLKVSKVRSNFKCAARKCKKSNNYTACMKKTLRKIYNKPSSFGKKKNFIQEANARSRRKGTVGTFGRWCRRNHLDVNGKVSLKCINKAKKSGNTKLIRRAVYAQNIKAYAGAKKKRRTSFGKKKGKAVEIFKKAAKKCKGSSDYRKCFTKTLRKMHNTSFGRIKKKKSRSIPNNNKLGPRLKGYSGKEPMLSVFLRINGRTYQPRVSKSTKKGYLKASIKGKKYQFKLKGPEKYVTLTQMKKTSRRASSVKRKKPTPQNKFRKFIYRKSSTHPKRKSPRVSATSVPVGTVRTGVDGNNWKVKKTKTGVKRWVKL